MSRILIFATLGLMLPILYFGFGTKSEKEVLQLAGSSTVAPLVTAIAERYESHHPGVKLEIQTGGSGRGIRDTRSSLIDLGMVSRSPQRTEQDLNWHPIAKDGIGIIVHSDNPLTSISKQQLKDLYPGTIKSWSQIENSRTNQVTVVHKAEGRSTLEVFLNYLDVKNQTIKPHVVIGDNQQGIMTVASQPAAIGYVSIGAAEKAIQDGTPIKILDIEGKPSSTEAIQKGEYDIARTLHIISKETPKGLVADFIKFAQSSEVSDLVRDHYLVPL